MGEGDLDSSFLQNIGEENKRFGRAQAAINRDLQTSEPWDDLAGVPADDSTEDAAFVLAEADRAREALAKFSELRQSLIEDVVMNSQTLVSWAQEHGISEAMATKMKQKTLRALRYQLRRGESG